MGAQAALYGHTHIAESYQEDTGMWVMNPGTSGYGGGSAGVIEVQNGSIVSCRIITQEDLE
jgi:predicted phosphodiesterase